MEPEERFSHGKGIYRLDQGLVSEEQLHACLCAPGLTLKEISMQPPVVEDKRGTLSLHSTVYDGPCINISGRV